MSDTSPRVARVAPLIRQELMRLIIGEVHDPRVGFVTLTDVDMSPDLKNARVWVSVMGSDDKVASSLRGLRAAAPFLRRALGRTLELRQVPALTFCHDTGLDRAARIAALVAGDPEPPPEGARPPLPTPQVHRDTTFAAPPARRRPAATRRPRTAAGRRRR